MHFVPAPFGRRLLARLLDLEFALVLTFVLVVPVGLAMYSLLSLVDRDLWAPICAGACYVLAYVALEYYVLVRREGQTLGNGLMGLRVVSIIGGVMSAVALPAAFVRVLALFAPFVLMSVAGGDPGSTATHVGRRR